MGSSAHSHRNSSSSLLWRMQASPPSEVAQRIATLRDHDSFVSRMDRISVLGLSEGDEAASNQANYGHTGCVNALGFNEDGSLLVSGSDDFRLCVWKVGHPDGSEPPFKATGLRRQQPYMSMGLSAVIHSGHRRNIFSAKFAPHTDSRRIISCAGDSQVRVFEIERAGSSTYIKGSKGRNWHEYTEADGVCTRVFRCHTDRAKRIALEGSPDVFLTCAEDGTVRQHDLRQSHSCNPATRGKACPQPLANYQEYNMGLYTLSVSIARPDVFVVAGTSPYAFLHDRRMTRRSMLEQWGQLIKPDLPTQCVRRFGLPTVAPEMNGSSRHLYHDHHVTATKLSNANGRDVRPSASVPRKDYVKTEQLLVSYSGDAIYRYDILADPSDQDTVPPIITSVKEAIRAKRKRSAEVDGSEQLSKRQSPPPKDSARMDSAPDVMLDGTLRAPRDAVNDTSRRRRILQCLDLASNNVLMGMEGAEREMMRPEEVEEHLDGLDIGEDDEAMSACRRYARALQLPEPPIDLASIRTAAQEAVDASHWPDVPPARSAEIHYEVSIGEDGELQVDYDRASADLDDEMDDDYQEPTEEDETSEDDEADATEADEVLEDEEEDMEEEDDEVDDARLIESMRRAREREAGVQGEVPVVLPLAKYEGHRNVDTVKDVNFGGLKDQHVVSGSDDGRMFIWDKATTELEGIWDGDGSVVNVIKFHPLLPVCAVSGIDDTVKVFAPTSATQKRFSCLSEAQRIMQCNRDGRNRGRGLMAPSAHALIELLSQRMNNGQLETDEDGNPTRVIRIDRDADCTVM